MRPDSPGVRIPPPTFYAAGLIVGLLASRLHPTPWLGRNVAETLSLLCLVAGAGFAEPALVKFFRVRTGIIPHRPATELVIAGPYRWTRNPMYVGLAFIYTGVAFYAESLWAMLLLPLVLVAIRRLVIAREEAYLERRFGPAYLAYKGRVRRWL